MSLAQHPKWTGTWFSMSWNGCTIHDPLSSQVWDQRCTEPVRSSVPVHQPYWFLYCMTYCMMDIRLGDKTAPIFAVVAVFINLAACGVWSSVVTQFQSQLAVVICITKIGLIHSHSQSTIFCCLNNTILMLYVVKNTYVRWLRCYITVFMKFELFTY